MADPNLHGVANDAQNRAGNNSGPAKVPIDAVSRKACLLQRMRAGMWGPPPDPPPVTAVNEADGWFSSLLFGWCTPLLKKARGEGLCIGPLYDIAMSDSAWVLGDKLSANIAREQQKLKCWDCMIGVTDAVSHRQDPSSCGTLRWVGCIELSPNPKKLYAGVEWRVPPKQYCIDKPSESAPLLAGQSDIQSSPALKPVFHNGTLNHERLFEAESGRATCEPVGDVLFPANLSLPTPTTPSLLWALLRSFGKAHAMCILTFTIHEVCLFAYPIVLQLFIDELDPTVTPHPSWWKGALCVVAMCLISSTITVALHNSLNITIRAGVRWQNALSIMMFEKAFFISKKAIANPLMSSGRVITMMNSDAETMFVTCCWFLHLFVICPLELVVFLFLLYRVVGWTFVGGVVVFVLIMPVQGYIARKIDTTREALVKVTDARMKATDELLKGIRIVKFMGWEEQFVASVSKLREEEIEKQRQLHWYRTVTTFLGSFIPSAITASVFVLHHLAGHELTRSVVFPTIAILSLLEFATRIVPMLAQRWAMLSVSASRFLNYLLAEERDFSKYASEVPDVGQSDVAARFDSASVVAYVPKELKRCPQSSCCACCMSKASKDEDTVHTLLPKLLAQNISLCIPSGKLTMIIGPTGSGKTTLLEALLGDADVASGSIVVPDCVAYVPQQPWIMHGSVRDNILFHLPMDLSFFDAVVEGCELKADISALVAGLDTEIGERGVNLSGGQKARISLARAIYSRRSVYLLDDPLSAVDAHVAEALVNSLLNLLKGTTRVLVTNQVQFLPKADNIVAVGAGGRIEFSGTYSDYLDKCHAMANTSDEGRSASATLSFAVSAHERKNCTLDARSNSEEPAPVDEEGPEDDTPQAPSPQAPLRPPQSPTSAGMLVHEEEKLKGSVPLKVYKDLIIACGGYTRLAVAAALALVAVALHTMNFIWLTLWAGSSLDLSSDMYLLVYIAILVCGSFADALSPWIILRMMRRGGIRFHRGLLESVVSAPILFFDTTPQGRILNRFARDVDQFDNQLEDDVPQLIVFFLNFFATLGVFLVAQPFMIFAIVPLTALFYHLAQQYSAANREVRRVESLNVSPVFSLLSEILGGVRTITAFQRASEFLHAAMKTLDAKFTTSYFMYAIHRWIDVRVGLIGAAVVTSIALLTLVSSMTTFGLTSGIGMSYLGITLAMSFVHCLDDLLMIGAEVEAEMNCVQRITEYTNGIPHEAVLCYAPKVQASQQEVARYQDTSNPHKGVIVMQNVCMRYRDGLPLVLNHLSLRIGAGEKIGVVGRTGSGKSTLMLALLRVVDCCDGIITVSGVRSTSIPLGVLRSGFAMIPQDPVLFEGTVRSNLDPFGEYKEEDLRRALHDVGIVRSLHATALKVAQKSNSFTVVGGIQQPSPPPTPPLLSQGHGDEVTSADLSLQVEEGGKNFSTGQRQLLCLARALLKSHCPFVLIDEATANVDNKLDARLQKAIRRAFKSRTVITIAHRLNTVMHCDRVLVMDSGSVAEFDSPHNLATNEKSQFRQMIASHGPEQERFLLQLAEKYHGQEQEHQ